MKITIAKGPKEVPVFSLPIGSAYYYKGVEDYLYFVVGEELIDGERHKLITYCSSPHNEKLQFSPVFAGDNSLCIPVNVNEIRVSHIQ